MDLRKAIELLAGTDLRKAEDGARWLCEYCDGSAGGDKTARRGNVGQIRGVWAAFQTALKRSDARPLRTAALDALGFIAFEEALNSAAIAANTAILDSISDILRNGSADERISAAGTISNLTVSDDNLTSKNEIARHPTLVSNLAAQFESSRTSTADRLIQFRAVGAFNNMARSGEAADLLERRGIPPVLERFLTTILDDAIMEEHEILVARTAMALAGLMGRMELTHLPRKGAMMRLCVKCLEHAINRLEGKNGMFGNVLWTSSVVLYPLYQLSIADANKEDLVQAGVVEELLRLVVNWRKGEGTRDLEWALLTLEQLSFNDSCRERIQRAMLPPNHNAEDAEPSDVLESLQELVELNPESELPKTRDTGGSIRQMVANLMANVCPEMAPLGSPLGTLVAGAEGVEQGQWVMISYNWDVQERAVEVCDALRAQNYVVWMDILEGCMEGDTLQAMANAVGNAAVVLVCVTSKYKESANCRREASYAHDLSKPIVPIIMESNYQPDGSWGWLGLIIAGKLYYDISDPARAPQQMAALLRCEELEGARRVEQSAGSHRAAVKRLKSNGRTASSAARTASSAGTESAESYRAESFRARKNSYKMGMTRWGSMGSVTEEDFERLSMCSQEAPARLGSSLQEELPAEVMSWLESLGRDMGRDNAWVFAKHRLVSLERVAALSDRDLSSEIEPLIPAVGHRVLLRQGLRVLRKEVKAKQTAEVRRRRNVCNLTGDDPVQCPLM